MNKPKYKSKEWYAMIGSKGGKKTGVKKGFAANPELARRVAPKAAEKRKANKKGKL